MIANNCKLVSSICNKTTALKLETFAKHLVHCLIVSSIINSSNRFSKWASRQYCILLNNDKCWTCSKHTTYFKEERILNIISHTHTHTHTPHHLTHTQHHLTHTHTHTHTHNIISHTQHQLTLTHTTSSHTHTHNIISHTHTHTQHHLTHTDTHTHNINSHTWLMKRAMHHPNT